jgi:hypothetical protein
MLITIPSIHNESENAGGLSAVDFGTGVEIIEVSPSAQPVKMVITDWSKTRKKQWALDACIYFLTSGYIITLILNL